MLWSALDYYMIDGVRHDAYLYILYVNGAGPQTRWLDMITRYGWQSHRCSAHFLRMRTDACAAGSLFNGRTTLMLSCRPLLVLFSIASSGWRKLVEGLSTDEENGKEKEDQSGSLATLSKAKSLNPPSCV